MPNPSPLRRLTAALFLAPLALLAQPGPLPAPMPVPAAVAIARPSADEVAQATASLQQFLAQADPATKALAAKYPDLLAVRPPRVNPAVVPFLSPGFRAKHAANVALARKGGIDLLFMGDSITDFWRNTGPAGVENPPRAGKVVFDKYYGGIRTANFGISGDTTQGVLYRLRDGEGQGFQPKAIMLMIGTNNAGSCSSASSRGPTPAMPSARPSWTSIRSSRGSTMAGTSSTSISAPSSSTPTASCSRTSCPTSSIRRRRAMRSGPGLSPPPSAG